MRLMTTSTPFWTAGNLVVDGPGPAAETAGRPPRTAAVSAQDGGTVEAPPDRAPEPRPGPTTRPTPRSHR